MMKKMNNDYSRKCIFSNNIIPITKLMRFTKTKENTVIIDKNKNLQGRGAYIENVKESILKAFEKKLLNKSFKMNITKENYDQLRKEIELIYGKETH
ncbi:YlxR family protein [Mycoplasma sp. CB776]